MFAWLAGKIMGSAIGAFLKPILARIFPTTEERLGTAEQKVKDETAIIEAVAQKQDIDRRVDRMSESAIDQLLRRRWAKKRS